MGVVQASTSSVYLSIKQPCTLIACYRTFSSTFLLENRKQTTLVALAYVCIRSQSVPQSTGCLKGVAKILVVASKIHIVISKVLYLLMWTVRMDACVYDVWMMHGCMYGNLAVSTRTLACVIAFNTRQCASNATASVCTEKATEARHHQARHPAPHSHQNNHKPQPAANQHHQQIKHTSAAPESVSLPNRCQMSPRLAYQFRTHPLKRSAHLLSVCSIMPTHGLV